MRTVVAKFIGLCIALFALTTLSYAATPPVLTLSDGTNTVTIDNSGVPTFSCTPATACSTTNVNVIPGQIKWQGKIGVFTVSATGSTKPKLSPPQIDLGLGVTTLAYAGPIQTL